MKPRSRRLPKGYRNVIEKSRGVYREVIERSRRSWRVAEGSPRGHGRSQRGHRKIRGHGRSPSGHREVTTGGTKVKTVIVDGPAVVKSAAVHER